MKITVRMDDITPDMDWKSFDAFCALFEKYGIRPLLGIVPANADPKLQIGMPDPLFYEKMKSLQAKGYVLAMHGCHHVYATQKGGVFPLNAQSEFAGRPEEEQRKLLTKGKALLEEQGIQTGIFMAPGHTFDRTTVKILRELGFSHITDGFGKAPYVRDGMTYLPIAFLRRLCFSDKEGITTIVIHANHSTKQELENYEEMFRQNRERFVPYAAFLEQKAVRQSVPARALEYMMALGKQWAARAKRRMEWI
ncbi:MAG: DUF2334 domain-containing protein [Eubacteriales bacterium]|nr:DUF2334 domain-containing protein [Eubacteriales bacterium]